MSAIYVQIGQCGNQVGQHFWKEALGIVGNDRRKCEVKSARHLEYGERLSSLLTYSGKLPLILLDSEAKPVRALHASRELGQFIREENVIIDKTGRGGTGPSGTAVEREEEERTSSWNRPRNATAERLKDARGSSVLSCSTVWPEGQARVRYSSSCAVRGLPIPLSHSAFFWLEYSDCLFL